MYFIFQDRKKPILKFNIYNDFFIIQYLKKVNNGKCQSKELEIMKAQSAN